MVPYGSAATRGRRWERKSRLDVTQIDKCDHQKVVHHQLREWLRGGACLTVSEHIISSSHHSLVEERIPPQCCRKEQQPRPQPFGKVDRRMPSRATGGSMSLYPTMSTLCLALFLARCRASWIDIETPLNKRSTVSFVDGSTYELVGAGEGSV